MIGTDGNAGRADEQHLPRCGRFGQIQRAKLAALNRTVRMVKDESTLYKVKVPTGEGEETEERDAFWVTRFDVELRGLPTADPVYLIAYFDLNQNGKRDAWEPWGYATQGVEAVGGFYFDPAAVTPVRTGTDWGVSFYIQDVDTDNDKLADAWEWKNAGMPNTDFAEWCNTYNGSVANHQGSGTIWTTDVNGNLALTAYGAQLFGLTVIDGPDANGAVKVEGLPEDVEEAKELMELLGQETALTLFQNGYKSYGLTVKSIAITPEGNVTLTWDVTGATGVEDGATYDVTGYFTGASTQAIYAVYGKADLGDDTWHKLGDIEVAGALTPNLQLTPDKCAIVSFNVEGVHPYDVGMILDKLGIAVRTGQHCAEPVMDHFSTKGMCRASFALYNTSAEVDALVAGVERAVRMLR